MGRDTRAKNIRIGCIGPSDSISVIQEVTAGQYPRVSLTSYVEERISRAAKPLDRCCRENEGILFTGIGVQESALARGRVTLPYEHVPRGALSLVRALWEMNRSGQKIQEVSIDVVTRDIIQSVTLEMGISFEAVHSLPFDPDLPETAYEEWHTRLFRNGRAQALVSGFGAVFDSLKRNLLPVFRLYPSRFEIQENLDRLLARITAKNLRSAGIAIQIIHLASIRKHSIHQYDDLKKEGRFYLELLDYARDLQASLFHMGREYVIYSTRGSVESRENLDRFRALLDWGRAEHIRIASGIGIGSTAFEAEKSGRKALANALKAPESAFFIVHEDRIQGPLFSRDELAYPIRVNTGRDLEMAGAIGIDPSYLGRIRALMAKTGKTVFDAQDLASVLGISERSARRILKKFVDAGFGRVSGKETAGRAGRPKQLIELMI